jgi:hypothetical protein
MRQPRSASNGRIWLIARVIVERSTPNQERQHVVGDTVTQAHQGGQQPVHEDQLVPGAGTDGSLPRAGGQPRLLPVVPHRPQLRH